MKFAFGLLLVALVHVSLAHDPTELKNQFEGLLETCRKEVGATKESVDKQEVRDEAYQNVLECMGTKTGFLEGDAGINIIKMLDNMKVTEPAERRKLETAIKYCTDGRHMEIRLERLRVVHCAGEHFQKIALHEE